MRFMEALWACEIQTSNQDEDFVSIATEQS